MERIKNSIKVRLSGETLATLELKVSEKDITEADGTWKFRQLHLTLTDDSRGGEGTLSVILSYTNANALADILKNLSQEINPKE